jgi:hypothetical protein
MCLGCNVESAMGELGPVSAVSGTGSHVAVGIVWNSHLINVIIITTLITELIPNCGRTFGLKILKIFFSVNLIR